MNFKNMYFMHKKTLWPLVALLSLFSIAFVLGQAPDKKPVAVVTIDGAQTPDRIPDWILWREVFKTVSLFADKSSEKGNEIWADKLQLSQPQINQLLQSAKDHGDMDSAKTAEAKNIKSSTKETKESRRIKLKQTQMSREVQILELRDALRARIGEDAFQRLQSYAKLNIAPTIKVGDVVRQ
jgi:hypothetical protein